MIAGCCSLEALVEIPEPEVDQPQELTTLAQTPEEQSTIKPAPTIEPTEALPTDEQTPATDPVPAPAKPKKLKVKADLKPKKLSIIKAALQVLQERKVPMTCPEMIDVMAIEGLWTSPGGKTPASTLYMVVT